MDSWFSSNETLELRHKYKKYYITPIKSNRKIALSKKDKLTGKWIKLQEMKLLENTPTEVYLEGLKHPVLLSKQVFKNDNGTEGVLYLITNELELKATPDKILEIYHKRWKIEEFYKSIKSNFSFSKSPTKNIFTQTNHFFCSIYTYFKAEILTKATKLKNHFQLKSRLYLKALQASMTELRLVREGIGCERWVN